MKIFIAGAWLGQHRTNTRDHRPKAFINWEADPRLSAPPGHQHRCIVRKSETPCKKSRDSRQFSMAIGIVTKPLVGSAQGGLVRVVFCEEGPQACCALQRPSDDHESPAVSQRLQHRHRRYSSDEMTMDRISNRIANANTKVCEAIRIEGIKAGIVTSFGFGGVAVIIHLLHLWGTVEPSAYTRYRELNRRQALASYKSIAR